MGQPSHQSVCPQGGQHPDCVTSAGGTGVCVFVCVCFHFSRVQLFATLWTVARQASLSMGFSRQECWGGGGCHALLNDIDSQQ